MYSQIMKTENPENRKDFSSQFPIFLLFFIVKQSKTFDFGKPMYAKNFGYDVTVRPAYVRTYVRPSM